MYLLNTGLELSTNGKVVGYYAKKVFTSLSNATGGKITVINRNAVCTVKIENLKCTTSVPIVELSGYVGNGFYLYDIDVTGLYIDNSQLYSAKSSINYAVLTFCL